MSVSRHLQSNVGQEKAIKTLIDWLLQQMEIRAHAFSVTELITTLETSDTLDWLTAIGHHIRLAMHRVALTPQVAAEAASQHALLVTELDNGRGWLVLAGFSKGRIHVFIVQGKAITERKLSASCLLKLMAISEGHIQDWLLVQAKAPLQHAVSPDDHAHLPPLRRLIEIMRTERSDLLTVLGLTLGTGLLALASPVAVQALVNSVAMGGMGQPLLILSLILFFFLAFAGAIHVLQSYLVELVQRRVFVRLASDLAYRLPRVSQTLFDRHNGAELVNRFFDILTLQKAGAALLLGGLSTAVQMFIGFILLAFYHPFLLAFDVILLLAISFILFVLGRGGIASAIDESIAKYALVAWLENVIGQTKTFKFHGGSEFAAKRTDQLALAYLTAKSQHYRVLLRHIIGSVTLYAFASTALLAIGGFLVIDGHLTLGQLVAAELIVSSALLSLIKFGKHLESYYDLMAGTDKIGHLLDLPLEREDGMAPVIPGPARLIVQDLSFGFGAHHQVFKALHFTVEPGEAVAILGGAASGKTLLAELLCGLRQPQSGHIIIDAQPLEQLRLEQLRRRVMVVGQLEIIADTLLENVRLGREDLDVPHVEHVLRQVGLWDIVTQLPDGLATQLTHQGAPLSTSQAHRLQLARAIIGEPALLILDGILDATDQDTLDHLAKILMSHQTPWSLLVLTASPTIAAKCQRIVSLSGVIHHA